MLPGTSFDPEVSSLSSTCVTRIPSSVWLGSAIAKTPTHSTHTHAHTHDGPAIRHSGPFPFEVQPGDAEGAFWQIPCRSGAAGVRIVGVALLRRPVRSNFTLPYLFHCSSSSSSRRLTIPLKNVNFSITAVQAPRASRLCYFLAFQVLSVP